MNTEQNFNNDPLKKLMKKARLQKPSDNFTDDLMKHISHEPIPESVESPSIINSIKWGGAILGVASAIYFIFFFNWGFMSLGLEPEQVSIPQIQQFITSMTTAFNQIVDVFGFFNESSVGAIAIASIAALYLIDRALRKFSLNNGYVLL